MCSGSRHVHILLSITLETVLTVVVYANYAYPGSSPRSASMRRIVLRLRKGMQSTSPQNTSGKSLPEEYFAYVYAKG